MFALDSVYLGRTRLGGLGCQGGLGHFAEGRVGVVVEVEERCCGEGVEGFRRFNGFQGVRRLILAAVRSVKKLLKKLVTTQRNLAMWGIFMGSRGLRTD